MSKLPEKILLATDGSGDARRAGDLAAELAGKLGAELHLSNAGVVPAIYGDAAIGPDTFETLAKVVQTDAEALLETERERLWESGVGAVKTHAAVGRADEQTVRLAEELGETVILVGSRGLGSLRRALMGSVSDSIVRHAHCPVLVVRRVSEETAKKEFFPAKIVLALDGSKEAAAARDFTAALAKETASELHLIHVLPVVLPMPYPRFYDREQREADLEVAREESEKFLGEQVAKLKDAGVDNVQTHFAMGQADAEIVRIAEDMEADLVAVGSRGLGPFKRALMGSVSNSVVHHAHCPVLVVRT